MENFFRDRDQKTERLRQFVLFAAFFILIFLMHFHFALQQHDDVTFLERIQATPLLPLLKRRYETWTSRILLEICSFTLVQHPMLWRFLDSLMMLLIVWSLNRLMTDGLPDLKISAAVCAVFFLIPFTLYSSAGWIVTSLVYVWPTACALFSMTPVKRILQGRPVPWYWLAAATAALIFAMNMEQTLAILFGLEVLLIGYAFVWLPRRKGAVKLPQRIFFVLWGALGVASLIFTFTCPGNFVRKADEVGSWFPEYIHLSLLRKIEMGYSSTLFHFVFEPNVLFLIFSVFLCCCVWMKSKNIWVRLAAAIPLAATAGFGMLGNLMQAIFPNAYTITQQLTNYGTMPMDRHAGLIDFVPDAVLLVVALSVLIAVWFAFSDHKVALLSAAVLLLGFASRMAMAFSPTIWASGDRTFTYMYYTIAFVLLLLFRECKNGGKTSLPLTALAATGSFGLLQEILR